MKKPYHTSDSLIEAVQQEIAVPLTQVTYSNQDILDFAYRELLLEQVPSILEYHEEYLVYRQNIKILPNQSKYQIPDRAIGMKLRDVFYIDLQNQICQMSRISPDDRNFFEITSGPILYPIHYYVENNSIVLVPEVRNNPVGHIQMTYFLRPNSLVPDNEAAISNSFSKTITLDNANLISGNILSIGSDVKITAGVNFVIGTNSSQSAQNLTTYINNLGNQDLVASQNNEICTLTYFDRKLAISSDSNGMVVQSTITVNCPSVPAKIVDRSLVDILQMEAGHSTLAYDVRLAPGAVSPTSLTFTESQLPQEFIAGDYVCARFESIVPQIPTDLHPLLVQRTCSRILSSMGDYEGMGATDSKTKRLEDRQTTIMEDRVDGSPLKVTNFNGLLRNTRTGLRGRR